MFFILSKIVHFAFMPMIWIFLVILLAIFIQRHRKRLLILAAGLVFFFGNPFILHEVNRLWEIPMTSDESLRSIETAVVLGGYTYYTPHEERLIFRQGSDRILQATRLLQEDKVDRLLLSGGSGFVTMPEMKEAAFVKDYLVGIDIPKRKILVDSTSRNSHENAVESARILEARSGSPVEIILVTSGFHMRRARACFEKQGFVVTSYSTDTAVGDRIWDPAHLFIPSAEAIYYWNVLIHEWVGYITYWMMDYL